MWRFHISQGRHLMLGDGLYVSRDIAKTHGYGPVCFRLLVYPGKTKRVTDQDDPLRTGWQATHSSAWVPPDCSMVDSDREETCVRTSAQVRILGILYGYHLLNKESRSRFRHLENTPRDS